MLLPRANGAPVGADRKALLVVVGDDMAQCLVRQRKPGAIGGGEQIVDLRPAVLVQYISASETMSPAPRFASFEPAPPPCASRERSKTGAFLQIAKETFDLRVALVPTAS